jgi:hypothetical protein
LPGLSSVPEKAPLLVQYVPAGEEDQVIVEDPPAAIEVGLAEMVTVGTWLAPPPLQATKKEPELTR